MTDYSKDNVEQKRIAAEKEYAEIEKKRNDLITQGRTIQTQINELNITLVRLQGKYQALSELLGKGDVMPDKKARAA